MSYRRASACIQLLISTLLFSSAAFAQSSAGAADSRPQVVIRTTLGDMVIELDAQKAPGSVDNFLAYVDDNFYADTVFHRVIEGFMIQGGGFTTNYQRKKTRPPVDNEAYNGLRNERYSIAMARTTAPHSATSQFFINSEDNQNLDHTATTQRGWGYTVFGRVVEGSDIVDTISRARTGAGGPFSRDVPIEPIVILAIDRHSVAPINVDTTEDADSSPGEPMKGAAVGSENSVIQSAQPSNDEESSGKTRVDVDITDDKKSTTNDIIKQN